MTIKIKDILTEINFEGYDGNIETTVNKVIILDVNNQDPSAIMWIHPKNNNLINTIQSGVIICEKIKTLVKNKNCFYLYTNRPRRIFQELLAKFFQPDREVGITNSASINVNVILGKNLFIGENVVIESNCKIGNNTTINHNTVICSNTIIGDNVRIGSNNVIGGVGFGYEKNESGEYEFIPHIGNVVIEDEVEIGNCTTVDRAVLGSTFLRKKVKIDNLVHIAHGVDIGENSLIIANAMVAGSVKIGKNVWVAPSSSILNQTTIGDNAIIGMGAVVIRDANENDIIIGNPGKLLNKNSNAS